MSDRPASRSDDAPADNGRQRRRDGLVLGTVFIGLMLLLTITGALELSEAIVSALVFTATATAYYLATSNRSSAAIASPDRNGPSAPETSTDADDSRWLANISSVVAAFPSPAFLVSDGNRIVTANRDAETIFRFRADRPILATTALRRPDLLSALQEAIESRTETKVEIRLAGDQEQIYLCQAVPITVQNAPFVLCVLSDLTAVKRAEKARADFLANASHELRTPLTSLSGFIETMRGPANDDVASWDRFLEIMQSQTERMRRLIHDLLSLSRIELNEHTRPDEVIDFNGIIAESIEAMRPVAEERSITLDILTPCDDIPVFGNRDELSQVAQNLIDNATKYSQPGTTVTVRAITNQAFDDAKSYASRQWPEAARMSIMHASETSASSYLVLRVEDQGRGIPREHLPRLGERFYRIDEGRDRLIGGTGLGLAIVKHIVSRHRGSFQVESMNGRGSAFSIILPQPETAARSDQLNTNAAE